jgi:hypothetical protein
VGLAIAPSASGGSLAVTEAAKYNGVYGLEVTVGSSCIADEDAVLPAQTVSGVATFEGCNSITAGAGGFTVTGTGDATFTAGNWIALESGFSVLSGGVFTAEIDAALTPFAWVQDDSPASETSYNVEFYVNLDGFTLGGGDELDHFVAYGGGHQQLRLVITSGAALVLEVRTDAGTYTSTSTVPTVAGWNKVEIGWTAGAGATISLTVEDGTPAQVVANTATGRINSVRWGAVGGVVTTSSGTILQDDFTSWR